MAGLPVNSALKVVNIQMLTAHEGNGGKLLSPR